MQGILLTNTGTPDEPTTPAVRRYLREFLSDPRVVHLPRVVWLPLLHGLILPSRSPKSAALYQKIWTPAGSPMRIIMQQLRDALDGERAVEIGMNYGNPSIAEGLQKLHARQVDSITILPLFPQYSHTSTGSSFDSVSTASATSKLPTRLIRDYHAHPAYIAALAASIEQTWQQQGKGEHLLISFHGIPERFAKKGDPYPEHCAKTARLIGEKLGLPETEWTLCYQSRFGYDKWLQPSTQDLFTQLPQRGIQNLDIICPAFAVDCLETLEEINIRGKKAFLESGGKSLNYIPALNATPQHIDMLINILGIET